MHGPKAIGIHTFINDETESTAKCWIHVSGSEAGEASAVLHPLTTEFTS